MRDAIRSGPVTGFTVAILTWLLVATVVPYGVRAQEYVETGVITSLSGRFATFGAM